MKKNLWIMIAGALIWGVPAVAEETELIQNAGFETYEDKNNAMFGSYTDFNGWERTGFSTISEKTDVYEGTVAVKLGATTAGSLYQRINNLTDAYYAANAPFRLTLHYKVVGVTATGDVSLESYWEHATVTDGLKDHDADKLQRVLSDSVQSEWQSLVIETTRPDKAKSFYLSFKTKAKCYVLLDSLSMVALPETPEDEPYITVTPKSLTSVATTIGNTVNFDTIRVKQGHLTSETTFRIGGTDASHFQLSATSMPADQSEMNIVVTYAPQTAGTHRASLIFDNVNHTAILPDMITLNGTCTDPSAKPEISVTPSIVPAFEVNVGQQTTQTISVTSINCTDYVYMRVDHITGAAFTIDGTMLPKNATSDVTIRFTPLEAGTYQSTLTIYSENAQSVVVTLNGTGRNPSPETVDWQVDFQWDMSHPLAVLDEHFDNAEHNKTLLLDGWQNVAKATARPWWGFDEAKTTPVRGEGKYAKATAYQYAKDSTDTWEMWLVTPALDYKNTPSQVFAFSVKGEYLPEEGNKALFEVYFIDANDPAHVFFQAFDGLSIPRTSDEDGVWVPFQIHLENQANIPDVFHMAFRYVSPNGNEGVVTYYVDDVSWGVVAEGVRSETQTGPAVRSEKILRDGQVVIRKNGIEYNVLGIPMQ